MQSNRSGTAPDAFDFLDIDDADIEVPDHIDSREAFGRRQTRDFGFLGARINPGNTYRTHNPLQNSGKWIKRACGHFSYVAWSMPAENASRELCRHCMSRASPVPELREQQRSNARTANDLLFSSRCAHAKSDSADWGWHAYYKHQPEHSTPNQCDDAFASDLGHMLDAIRDEHTRTLQAVINDMTPDQPGVVQIREFAKRSDPSGTTRTNAFRTTSRPSCTTQMIRLPCEPVHRPHCESVQPVYIPPWPAQKLNIGAPRQLPLSINDPRSDLCDRIRTMEDLIALVDSVADDLDLDLDVRPSAEDDRLFDNAPFEDLYETPMEVSAVETLGEVASEEIDSRGVSWLGWVVKSLVKLLGTAPRLDFKGVDVPGGYVED